MIADRALAAARRLRPTHRAQWVLIGLLLAGVVLRVLAAVSWWPTTTTIADSWPYAAFANGDALENPQHPPGYPWLLAGLGVISRQVAFTIVVQHLLGMASAVVLYAAVTRLTGSRWAALVPAAVGLLGLDQILLEHSVMSEGPFVFVIATTLYATVRVIDEPDPWWRWPVACGVLLMAATLLRSAGLFLAPVVLLAVVLSTPRPWLPRWRAPAAIACTLSLLLTGYAVANYFANGSPALGPAQGWHLYGRVAPFADCSRFEPPPGTEALCEARPAAQRPGGDFYLYDRKAPAVREFGRIGSQDDKLAAFARAVIVHQPRDYLDALWGDLKAYYVPSSRAVGAGYGGDLDPQLDWAAPLPPDSRLERLTKRDVEAGMEGFYDPFHPDLAPAGLSALHDLQRVLRFGATALAVTTLLCLIGLLVGPRRERVGVLLFGLGGLALIIAPTLSVYYVARYTVPLAAPLAAGAAIALLSIWRLERRRVVRARADDHGA